MSWRCLLAAARGGAWCCLLLACSRPASTTRPDTPGLLSEAPVPFCEGKPAGGERNACYLKQAGDSGKRGYCLRLEGAQEQAECIVASAQASLTATDCVHAKRVWPRIRDRCLQALARHTQDPHACDPLAAMKDRDRCIYEVAVRARKWELCAGIKQNDQHDACLQYIANTNRDAADCAPMRNPVERDNCRLRHASNHGDVSACAAVENLYRRESCFINRAREPHRSPEVCQRVTRRKAHCWRQAAIGHDPALCERVGTPGSFARQTCYEVVAAETPPRGADVCAAIPGLAQRETCWARMARNPPDPARCEQISDRETADDCWALLGAEVMDYCARIQRSEQARACALEGWHKARDVRACGLLGPRALQDACRSAVAGRKG